MFTIVGPPEANEKALFLLYNQLESESGLSLHQSTSILRSTHSCWYSLDLLGEKQRRVGATLGEPIQEEI